MNISAIAVFAEGVLSFLSPCVLPLLPIYIGYLSGGAKEYDRKNLMVNTILFVLGISFVFFLLGLGVTELSRFLVTNKRIIEIVGGVLIVLLGLVQIFLYGRSAGLSKEFRLPFNAAKMTMSPVTAFLLGLTFSFAWTPCVGPILSSVLMMAAAQETQAMGFLLIGLYTLGFILPFLIVAFFAGSILKAVRNNAGVVKYTVKIGGVLMVIIGVLMVSGQLSILNGIIAGM